MVVVGVVLVDGDVRCLYYYGSRESDRCRGIRGCCSVHMWAFVRRILCVMLCRDGSLDSFGMIEALSAFGV